MSKNVVKRGPNYNLQQEIEDMKRDIIQLKASQPAPISISNEGDIGATVVAAGTKQNITITLTPQYAQTQLSMIEWSIYNGSVATANDYFHGFGGSVNRGLYPIISGWSYEDTVGPGGYGVDVYNKNVFRILFINNDSNPVTILMNSRFRYLSTSPVSA